MPSMYDCGYTEHLRKHKNDKAKKDYIDNELRRMRDMEDGISLYDLNHVARITRIFKEADERFD